MSACVSGVGTIAAAKIALSGAPNLAALLVLTYVPCDCNSQCSKDVDVARTNKMDTSCTPPASGIRHTALTGLDLPTC